MGGPSAARHLTALTCHKPRDCLCICQTILHTLSVRPVAVHTRAGNWKRATAASHQCPKFGRETSIRNHFFSQAVEIALADIILDCPWSRMSLLRARSLCEQPKPWSTVATVVHSCERAWRHSVDAVLLQVPSGTYMRYNWMTKGPVHPKLVQTCCTRVLRAGQSCSISSSQEYRRKNSVIFYAKRHDGGCASLSLNDATRCFVTNSTRRATAATILRHKTG